jgi:hypothetical protein
MSNRAKGTHTPKTTTLDVLLMGSQFLNDNNSRTVHVEMCTKHFGLKPRQSFKDIRLASLVTHHSEAAFEARLRGCVHALHAFPCEYSAVAVALIFCDMTTSPKGIHITFEERIAEILCRYKEQDLVNQSIRQATSTLSLDVERTKQMLHQHEINALDIVSVV